MKQLLLIILLQSFLVATPHNIFIIKDKDGKVLRGKRIAHSKNNYLKVKDASLEEIHKLTAQLDQIKKKKNIERFKAQQSDIISKLDALEARRNKLAQSALDYNKENMLLNAKKHLGEDYVWGGTTPGGFDCSGYMQYIYKKEGVAIPRTAYQQSKIGKEISRFELKKGDLLFFLTDKSRNIPITHVGMYLGNDQFIHAASKKKGIIITSLNKSRYSRLFVKATRVIK